MSASANLADSCTGTGRMFNHTVIIISTDICMLITTNTIITTKSYAYYYYKIKHTIFAFYRFFFIFFYTHLYCLVGCLNMIVWTHAVLGVLYEGHILCFATWTN